MMHQEIDPHSTNGETEPFEMGGYAPQRGSGPLVPPADYFQQPPSTPPAGWTPRPKVTVGNWLTILTLVLGFVGMAYTFGSSQATTNNRLSRLEDDVHSINAYQTTEHLIITVESVGAKAHASREVIHVPRSIVKSSGQLQQKDEHDLDTRGYTIPPEIKR